MIRPVTSTRVATNGAEALAGSKPSRRSTKGSEEPISVPRGRTDEAHRDREGDEVPVRAGGSKAKFISSSLGVECSFCHVEGALEKDDKKPKQTARKMMQMMAAINQANFAASKKSPATRAIADTLAR